MKLTGMRGRKPWRGNISRFCAIALAGVLAMSVSGCGGKDKGESGNQATGSAKQAGDMHAYSAFTLDAEGLQLSGTDHFYKEGDRIYTQCMGSDETGNWHSYVVSFAVEEDRVTDAVKYILPEMMSGDVNKTCMDEDGNLYAVLRMYDITSYEEETSFPEDAEDVSADDGDAVAEETATAATAAEFSAEEMSAMPVNAAPVTPFQGEVIELEAPADMEEGKAGAYLLKYAADGTLTYATTMDKRLTESESFYVNSMVATKDAVLLSNNGDVALFKAEDGNLKTMVMEGGENGWLFLTKLRDGRVIVSGYSDNGEILQEIDLASAKAGASYSSPMYLNPDSVTAGETYDICWYDGNGVYAMNLGDEKGVELMNFIDSDLGSAGFNGYAVITEDKIIANLNTSSGTYQTAFGSGYSEDESGNELTLLTPVDAATLQNKEVITLGTLYSDSHIAAEVVKFNKESNTHRIRIINYMSDMTGEDYTAAQEAFNTDIISGNIPDMVILDTSMSLESYYAKGVFEPLDDYIAKDPELQNVAFMDNVLDAMKYQDKTYLVTPGFSAITITVAQKHVKDVTSWTTDAFMQTIEKSGVPYETAFGYNVDAASILQYFVLFNSSDLIDYKNHKCNFNSEEFIGLLQLANRFPAERNDEGYEYDDTVWREGKALFNISGFSDFDSYWRERYLTYGEDLAFIGFPTASGEGASSFMADSPIAMSASSKHKDACWNFMRRLYSEEYQEGTDWSFPVRMSTLEKRAKKSMEPEMWLNPETGETEEMESYWGFGNTSVKKTPLTQEDVDTVMAFLKTLTVSASFNEQISTIIQEDAAPFFQGQKSAEEVAGIIQSRVQVYLNENS